jgi:hypothetical protein
MLQLVKAANTEQLENINKARKNAQARTVEEMSPYDNSAHTALVRAIDTTFSELPE